MSPRKQNIDRGLAWLSKYNTDRIPMTLTAMAIICRTSPEVIRKFEQKTLNKLRWRLMQNGGHETLQQLKYL